MDFYVLPVASWEEQLEEILDIDGARIGFFRSKEQPDKGRIWLFHGNGGGGGDWEKTEVVLPVDAKAGRTTGWVRITLREDLNRQAWDLWVNEVLAGCDAGFQEKATGHTSSYVIMGDAVEHLVLDNLSIGNLNPLGADSDGDGMLDQDEAKIGSDPSLGDVDGTDGTGASFRSRWIELLTQTRLEESLIPLLPIFSAPSGLATEAFRLEVTAPGANAVYYTTDGSEPHPNKSPSLEGPLEIGTTTVIRARSAGENGKLSDIVTAAWIFPEDVVGQKLPEGWPESMKIEGTRTLPLQPEVKVSDSGGELAAAEVAGTFEKAPIVVLAVPPDQLFGELGFYEKSLLPLKASGAAVWIEAETGRSGGAAQATFQVSGESSRNHDVTLKHSFRITFPKAAEAGPVFGVSSFPCDQFVLRNPSQDSWAVGGGHGLHRQSAKYVMDPWASRWLEEQGRRSLRHQWVHVFLNGSYWGVYDAVEQHDSAYQTRHGNGSGKILLAPTSEGPPRAIFGNASGWHATLARLRNLSGLGEKASDQQWEQGTVDVDLEGLIDYMLWNWWLGNYDWPLRNWLLTQDRDKWSFISWDVELCGDREKAEGTEQRLATDAYVRMVQGYTQNSPDVRLLGCWHLKHLCEILGPNSSNPNNAAHLAFLLSSIHETFKRSSAIVAD